MVELVRGELVEFPFNGARAGLVGAHLLGSFHEQKKNGGLFLARCGYILERNPDTVRAPDMSFVHPPLPKGDVYISGPPDLAIEIISFNENFALLEEKIRDWRRFGTPCVIVIDPQNEVATVHEAGTTRHLAIDDTLDAPTVLPGWSVPLRDLFAWG